MNSNFDYHPIYAQFLANEKLDVYHDPSIETASFDVQNRTLKLPILRNMEGFVYQGFICHEVSHALYTPADSKAYEDYISKGMPHVIVNIVEDARIEKLLARKYGGVQRIMREFYVEICSKDFFELKKTPIVAREFIDKLNLHFKLVRYGVLPEKINFANAQEYAFLQEIEDCETFEEVIDISERIFEYIKKDMQQKQNKQSQQNQNNSNSPSQKQKGQEQQKENSSQSEEQQKQEEKEQSENPDSEQSQSDENSESGNGNDKTQEQSSSERENGGDSLEEKSANEKQNTKSSVQENQEISKKISCSSQDSMDKGMSTLYVKPTNNSTDIVFLKDKKINPDNFIVSSDDFFTRGYNVQIPVDILTEAKMRMRKNMPAINKMVNIFLARKKAKFYAKTMVSKTGKLDLQKLHSYKTSEDIFLRNRVEHKGKNHGFVMFLDCSSSMSEVIDSCALNVSLLSQFCKKLNLPLEVYGFFTGGASSILDKTGRNTTVQKDTIMSSGVCTDYLVKFIDTTVRNDVYTKQIEKFLSWSILESRHSYYRKSSAQRVNCGSLSSTALNFASVLSGPILEKFMLKNKTEKNNVIFLTDGGATDDMITIKNGQISCAKKVYVQKNFKNFSVSKDDSVNEIIQMYSDFYNVEYHNFFITNNININLSLFNSDKILKKGKDFIKYNTKTGFDTLYAVNSIIFDIGSKKLDIEDIHRNSYKKDNLQNVKQQVANYVASRNNYDFLNEFIEKIA